MLDTEVLRDDPLVVVLVVTSGKGTRVPRFPFRRSSRARNESQHPFPEVLLNEVFVKVERRSTDKSDVIAHQALNFERGLRVRRLIREKSRVRLPVLPLSARVEVLLLDGSRFIFDGRVRILIGNWTAETESSVAVHHLVEQEPVTQHGHLVGTEVGTSRTLERHGRRQLSPGDVPLKVLLGSVNDQGVRIEALRAHGADLDGREILFWRIVLLSRHWRRLRRRRDRS